MVGLGRVIAVLCFVVLVTPVVRAQSDDDKARQLFVDGDRAYAEGRYEDAVDLFARAYELSARPLLLFNLANTYERLGRYGDAAEALRRYLPDAPAAEREALRKRIARLDERERARQQREREITELRARECPTCAVCPDASACPDCPTCPEPPRQPRSRALAYSLMGAGALAVTTGVVFGFVALDRGADADALCRDGLCPVDARGPIDDQKRYSLAADLSIGAGVALAGAGFYLWWRARDADARDERAAIAPVAGPGFAGVQVVGDF